MTLPPLEPVPKNEKEFFCEQCQAPFKLEVQEIASIEKEGKVETKVLRKNEVRCPTCRRSTFVRKKEAGR